MKVDNDFFDILHMSNALHRPRSLTMEERLDVLYATAYFRQQLYKRNKKTVPTPGHPVKYQEVAKHVRKMLGKLNKACAAI